MPEFPIIDTHLHLWDPSRLEYPWLKDVPDIAGPYLIEDYQQACGSVSVDKMVFVQCECNRKQFIDELNWVTEISHIDQRIQGIVPWAPLEKGDAAREDLERLITNPLVKGIRRIIQHELDGNAFARLPDFIRGVQLLADYDLSFDLCVGHEHLQSTIELVDQCPDTRFILDHIGKPDIKRQVMQPWNKQLKTLAGFPNVFCKMSGLVTEADWQYWTPQDLEPYIDQTIEIFGFDRILFGGDWPVATLATDYSRWVDVLDASIMNVSESDRRKFYFDNAMNFYRLYESIK